MARSRQSKSRTANRKKPGTQTSTDGAQQAAREETSATDAQNLSAETAPGEQNISDNVTPTQDGDTPDVASEAEQGAEATRPEDTEIDQTGTHEHEMGEAIGTPDPSVPEAETLPDETLVQASDSAQTQADPDERAAAGLERAAHSSDDADPAETVMSPETGDDDLASQHSAIDSSAARDEDGHDEAETAHETDGLLHGDDAQAEDASAHADNQAPAASDRTPGPARKSGGGISMVLGGVTAAAIGFGAAQYESGDWPFSSGEEDSFRSDLNDRLEAQDEALQSLGTTLETAAGETAQRLDTLAQEVAATSGAIGETRGALGSITDRVAALEDLPEQLSELDRRLTDLAKRPIADNVSREAISAYEDELARLQSSMEEQRAVIEETIAAEKAKMEQIAEEASQMEERALRDARLSAARSAITRIIAALESGEPFDEALDELAYNSDTAPPEALRTAATDGVTTQEALRESFPDLARAALRAVRSAEPAEGEEDTAQDGTGGVGSVLERMFEVRSTAPREGTDADAVLSRAEAAVRGGDIDAAIAEIEALPSPAKAELETWVKQARVRAAAHTAAQEIAQRLNQQ